MGPSALSPKHSFLATPAALPLAPRPRPLRAHQVLHAHAAFEHSVGVGVASSRVPDARAVDVVAVGGLVVGLINSDALRAVVATVRNWLSRGQSTTHAVRLEIDGDAIDLSAASTAEQERLVEVFVTRHGTGKDEAWAANAKP